MARQKVQDDGFAWLVGHGFVMPNQLIDSLPERERVAVAAELHSIDLIQDLVLWDQGQQMNDVYFPESGMISIVTSLGNRPAIETGTVGREGMVGIEVHLGVTAAPNRTLSRSSREGSLL